jgi:hypothetical protein
MEHVNALWELSGGAAPAIDQLEFSGPTDVFASPFAVTESAATAVGAATSAAADLLATRGGPRQRVSIDRAHAAAAFSAERLLRVDGSTGDMWATLSGRYAARHGRFVQLHCNFPHHAAGVAERLGVPEERAAFEAAIAEWDAEELETALIEAGMVGAMYRTTEEWDAHPHALATRGLPVLELAQLDGAGGRELAPSERPLEGVRVLDCSRVLAGPVAGMTLASHGADVLRVGADHLPFTGAVTSTGFGKRNTNIDLRSGAGRDTFTRLLAEADVLIDAFRPGALASHGFSPEDVARIRPGIVVVQICAFDWSGPWGGRRGFDSIIQTTTGIAMTAAGGDGRPVHLPVQALDHATGFLGAFAAMRGLGRRQNEGGSWLARLSLLRTRNWLVDIGGSDRAEAPADFEAYLHEVDSAFGRLTAVRAVGGLEASPPRWDRTPSEIGSAPAEWL